MIKVEELSFSYNKEITLDSISFSVKKGEIFGVLGPNGSGKTTLLKLLARTLPNKDGQISIDGNPLYSYSNKEYAKMVAVLPQIVDTTFSFSVKETIKMGRYAHQTGIFSTWSYQDEQIVQEVMEEVSISHLQSKNLQELSGGELQRVLLARALAQQTDLLLLDEPTNHLDVSHQMNLFNQLVKWKIEKKLTVVAIFHDLNLASLYCDRILLLDAGKVVKIGQPKKVMQSSTLNQVYDASLVRKEHPDVAKPMIGLIPEQTETKKKSLLQTLNFVSTNDLMIIRSDTELKSLSSSLIGGGFNWCSHFINRSIDMGYECENPESEMLSYLLKNGLEPISIIGMMTTGNLDDSVVLKDVRSEGTVLVVVTASKGNSAVSTHIKQPQNRLNMTCPFTIFVFVEANLTDVAFVQVLTTATESNLKAIFEEKTEKYAPDSGISTNSICIASTQTAIEYKCGGPQTPIGKLVGKLVFEATKKAIKNHEKKAL